MIQINGMMASLDFLLCPNKGQPAILSFYDRSQSIVRSIGATLNDIGVKLSVNGSSFYLYSEYEVIIAPIITGKDKFYHAIAISKSLNSTVMIYKEGEQERSFYNLLMNKFDLPLMKEWQAEIYAWSKQHRYVGNSNDSRLIKGSYCISDDFAIGNDRIHLGDLRVVDISINEETLKSSVKTLFNKNLIWISKEPQKRLEFSDMDTYFKMYGKTLVTNLEKQIKALSSLNGNMDYFVMKHMRLYPQQAAQVNGVFELLNRSSYAILNEGMGTGKTAQAAGICEGYFIKKYFKSNPGKTIRDAYLEEGTINYRNIVMCPGHLVQKWADHIKDEIPYARVTILNNFSQLIEIKKRGIKRNGREFFVISKDFAKLSYQSKPTPRKRRFGNLMKKVCNECGEEIPGTENVCRSCKSVDIKLVKSGYKGEGMVCHHCNNILIPYKTAKLFGYLDEGEYTQPLDFYDFVNQNLSNSCCYYCGTELWQPHVANLGENNYTNSWYRATHYANKTHKNKKTVWVHKDYASDYFDMVGEKPLNEIDSDVYKGVRKVAPGIYIKKQLKGFFDFAIFDEVHLFKSGSSAQANCMSAIISSSKKHLALTGTIAGGMANHIFYLIYRLDPRRMQKAGYEWKDEMGFIEKYGVLERHFEANDDGRYNSSSKGRQKGSPSPKPGISPLIFTDFLLDKTVFLDLADLSKYLPPLKEIVELVEIPRLVENDDGDMVENTEYNILNSYRKNIDVLKMASMDGEGMGILSSMLQFSLSYLDKPYGVSPIKSPKSGVVLVEPQNFEQYRNVNTLLAKEKRLLEIVNKELSEKRNMVIYAEFTGKPETCVSYRIKELLETHCNLKGKVEVIESSYPAASQREAWMHKKASEGIKVFITNPRNVETGLDFCFMYNGKAYNYPTLIYYQMGYSLFTIWQSSRRHYRLNQRMECRTYYMAIDNTVQREVISLIAEKMAATSAIQGKFSTEGLTAMANGIDARMKLAQALSNMDNTSGSNLQGMFDVINQDTSDDSQFGDFRPMLIVAELLGEDMVKEETSEMSAANISQIFEMYDDFVNNFTLDQNIDLDLNFNVYSGSDIPNIPKTRKKASAVDGQMVLF